MKVSIVTVTWNSGRTVEDTIKSVLCQTYKNYEYLIIDGLSKDSTLDIARKYEPFFEGRMKIYSEKDKGIYDASLIFNSLQDGFIRTSKVVNELLKPLGFEWQTFGINSRFL